MMYSEQTQGLNLKIPNIKIQNIHESWQKYIFIGRYICNRINSAIYKLPITIHLFIAQLINRALQQPRFDPNQVM
jgi:hypothetical protein